MDKIWGIYIMGNTNKTLYTGVTNHLPRRILEHKHELNDGFTKKYGLKSLFYYEFTENAWNSIIREKQIKNMKRKEKLSLIEEKNPLFIDLTKELFEICDIDYLIPDKPE